MTVDTTLERRLRDAFARSAAQAPVDLPPVGDPPLLALGRADRADHRRSVRRTALLVGAVAATVSLLVALRDTRDDTTPAFQPAGTEVPLTEVTPPDPGTPVKPGSLVGVQVPGHPVVAMFTTLGWQDGRVVEQRCTWSHGSSGCIPSWNAAPDLSRTSTIDNHDGSFDLYTWSSVPATAAFVSWSSPSGLSWQRPVAGFVGFPVTGEIGDDRLTAYDTDGNVIDEVDYDVAVERLRGSTPPGGWRTDPANPKFLAYAMTDNLSGEQHGELWGLTMATLGACLGDEGAAWEGCVDETEAVVDARFTAMGGELVPNEAAVDPEVAVELPITATTTPRD
jgi:hypothetical protein